MQASLIAACRSRLTITTNGSNGSLWTSRASNVVRNTRIVSGKSNRSLAEVFKRPLCFASAQNGVWKSKLARRQYCTVTVDEAVAEEEVPKYSDEHLMTETIEVNGFRILGDNETEVDIPRWEKATENAFNQMRFADAVSAYENIRGVGPNAAKMSEYHIRALDSLGSRDDEIIAAYRDMRQRNIPILAATYAKVMKALFRSGETKRVVSLFELMLQEGNPGTAEAYTVLLTLYYKENPQDIETAQGILATMNKNGVKPDIDVLDRVLLFFVEAKRPDLIKAAYTQYVIDAGLSPKRITCSIMAETMLEEGRYDTAESFLKKLYELQKYPRLRTYELIIQKSLERNKKKQADEALREMLHSAGYKTTLGIFKAYFQYYKQLGKYEGLQETLARMVVEKVAPDAEVMELLMMSYFENRKNDEFLQVFIQMLDRQMIPSRHLWTHRLHVLTDDLFTDHVVLLKEYEYMLQAGFTPTEEELRLVVAQLHKHNRPDLVEKFANADLEQYGVKLDATDYSLMMRSYLSLGRPENVLQTYHKFVTAALVDSEPHVIAVQSLLQWNNVDDAVRIFEDIKKAVTEGKLQLDDTQAPRLMDAFTLLGNDGYTYLQQIFDLVVAHSPNAIGSDLFDVFIRFLSKHSHLEEALAYYRTMQSQFKYAPTTGIYFALLSSFAKATERDQTTKHLSTMFEIFRTIVFDPALQPLPAKLVSTFLLCFVRHGSQLGFSHAINLYKNLGGPMDENYGQVEIAALRKWANTFSDPSSLIPEKFMARSLESLGATLPSPEEMAYTYQDL